ncbi:MAG TPA: NAD(P)H-dependent oxidoreductase [Solirubrobacteraceae bacterium]
MAHLLQIDSSIQGDRSVSRRLTARAADVWRAAHPGGTVTYRDLGADPLPHLDSAGGLARIVGPDDQTPAQAASWARSLEVVGEVLAADTVILGLPLYDFGPPSSIKSWVDHLVGRGLSIDAATGGGAARRTRADRPGRAGRRLRSRNAAGGLGSRGGLAAARDQHDRAGAALHHRRADPGRSESGDG